MVLPVVCFTVLKVKDSLLRCGSPIASTGTLGYKAINWASLLRESEAKGGEIYIAARIHTKSLSLHKRNTNLPSLSILCCKHSNKMLLEMNTLTPLE